MATCQPGTSLESVIAGYLSITSRKRRELGGQILCGSMALIWRLTRPPFVLAIAIMVVFWLMIGAVLIRLHDAVSNEHRCDVGRGLC